MKSGKAKPPSLPPTPENILWDLIESESSEQYFLDSEDYNAELPGICIIRNSSPLSPNKSVDGWTVLFGRGIGSWSFQHLNEAHAKVSEILKHAPRKVRPRIYLDASIKKKQLEDLAHEFGAAIHQNGMVTLYEPAR